MRILLFGGSGQVGWELQRSLAPLGDLVVPGRAGAPAADFLQPQGLGDLVLRERPDVIVNAAAYTAVDRAEADEERARIVNAVAPAVLAQAADACGAMFVHYSTDYVFDGSGQRPWTEQDAPAPLNAYGRTKLDGESAAARARRHLILRTSWVYAARGGNFARTMLRLCADRERVAVVDDQFGAPTGAELLADVTAHAILRAGNDPALCGLYHVAAAGETTWYGYARFVLGEAARLGRPDRASVLQPIPSSAYPTPAARPKNSRLDTGKLRAAFGLTLPAWQRGVARALEEILGKDVP
jgi:dTDP-4-dehydrorhamnose reductase